MAESEERGLARRGVNRKNRVQRSALCQLKFIVPRPLWRLLAAGALAISGAVAFPAMGQSVPTVKAEASPSILAVSPRSWAVDAAANEITALHHLDSYLRYDMHIVDEKGNMTRDMIESKDGTVARLILRNDRPLTDDEDMGERQRLNDMIAHPSDFARHIRNDASSRKIADQLIRLMPDAMIYTYTPGQPQTGKNPGGLEVVLDYKPNPNFKPSSITAEALTGLEGRIWIDAKTRYVVRMEGTIFRGINFGWGMVAHIYPGGKLVLEQTDAGGGRWIFTHFTEELTVRALMVKTMNVRETVDVSSFQALPGPISYQDAIQILLNTPLPKR